MNQDPIHIIQGSTWEATLDAEVDLTGATGSLQIRWPHDDALALSVTPSLGGVTRLVQVVIPAATSSAVVTTGRRPGLTTYEDRLTRAYALEGALEIVLASGRTVTPWRGLVWLIPEIVK